ncbi:MAG: GNAT family N-acetyltransferase [Bacteroidetes bacterium]|nr:GNAT family N-acetyltransferase [Bacteroidota bacterium]
MLSIEIAKSSDAEVIFKLIYELAVFEKAPEKVTNSSAQILKDGFTENPLFVCFVARLDNQVVGISLNYNRYSTWIGRCLYLEDLIITESHRGKGIGKALFLYTIDYAKQNDYKRLNWQVLDWNTDAIDFYKALNAQTDGEWLNAYIDL